MATAHHLRAATAIRPVSIRSKPTPLQAAPLSRRARPWPRPDRPSKGRPQHPLRRLPNHLPRSIPVTVILLPDPMAAIRLVHTDHTAILDTEDPTKGPGPGAEKGIFGLRRGQAQGRARRLTEET